MRPFNAINNLRRNKGKTSEENKISVPLTTLKGQKDPRLRARIHIHTAAAALHLNKSVFETECVYWKQNWQDLTRFGKVTIGAKRIMNCRFDWTYMQTWQMFNSLRESGERKSYFLGDTAEMTCQRWAVLLFAWVIITIQHAFPQELIAMWKNRPMQAILYLHSRADFLSMFSVIL